MQFASLRNSLPAARNLTRREAFGKGGATGISIARPIADVGIAMKFRDTPPPGDDGLEPSAPESKMGRSRKRGEPGFDRWITKRLHEVFDPVVEEKVPDEFERLLDEFAGRSDIEEK